MMERKDNDATNTKVECIYIDKDVLFSDFFKDKAIKVVFDREIHPCKLKEVLYKSLNQLKKLRSQQSISGYQWYLLFPKAGCGPVSSNAFDSSLMICLLRNLTDVQIYKKWPSPTDLSRNADLSRLYLYRNKRCHMSVQNNHDLRSIPNVAECTQAIKRLSGEVCRNYEFKISANDSKDANVVVKTCLHEGCNLNQGISFASWRLILVDKIKKTEEVLCFCAQYKLFQIVFSNLKIYPTEEMQWNVNVQFLNETFCRGIIDEVPSFEHLRSRYRTNWTISEIHRKSARRNSCNQWTNTSTSYDVEQCFVSSSKAIRFVETTTDASYGVERLGFRNAEYEYALIGEQNNTKVSHGYSFLSETVLSYNDCTKQKYYPFNDLNSLICNEICVNHNASNGRDSFGAVSAMVDHSIDCYDTESVRNWSANNTIETSFYNTASQGNDLELYRDNGAQNDAGYCTLM